MDKFNGLSVARHARRRLEADSVPRRTVGKHRALFNKKGNLIIGAPVRTPTGLHGEIVGYRGTTPQARFRGASGDVSPIDFLGRCDSLGFPTVRFAVLRDDIFASVA